MPSFNYYDHTISAKNHMPQFPGFSRMKLVFPGLSSAGKNDVKIPGLSRIFKDAMDPAVERLETHHKLTA